MTKEKDFYRELPAGYREDKVVDAKSKKFTVYMNLAAVIIMIAVYVITDIVCSGRIILVDLAKTDGEEDILKWYLTSVLLPLGIFVVASFVYIVLHELTHGVAYKVLTGEKLTFGFTKTVAYCGVPNIYLGKKTSLIALLSPFLLFDLVFIIGIAIAGETTTAIIFRLLFAIHFGGCAGDLYDTILLIFKYRKGCLMKDDGPKQVFYVRTETEE